ncbi:MAG: hypothetical protein HKN47_22470 [Pirellulaceae bacterium]|nr:hypothetical protein [Pirellulaceae bacterium]
MNVVIQSASPVYYCISTFCLSLVLSAIAPAQDVVPLPRAHAHNDYLHDQPLIDALDQGFCSVEADIYLVDGKLLVAHDRDKLQANRSLQNLYLDPLRQRVRRNGGHVFPDGPMFTLLIDIKSDATDTYRALSKLLAQYDDVFSSVDSGKLTQRAVTAIISGNRDFDSIRSDSPRYAGIDGRLSDLDSNAPSHELPLISDHWGRNFRWRGEGDMSDADKSKLKQVIDKAHADGRRIRFWAIPDQASVWKALNEAGVDLINTDKLTELSEFLRTTSSEN